MSGPTSSLVQGLVDLIVGAGLGVWRPTGTFQPGETAITVAVMPADPERVIALTPYPVTDGPLTSSGVTGVQIRLRAGRDPRIVQDTADALFALLHMRAHSVLGGIRCPLIWRQSQAWIGLDALGRQEITANYYLRTETSSPHLDE